MKSARHAKLSNIARTHIINRIVYFLDKYKNDHQIILRPSGRIAIRNTRSRWGSCSSKGHLNFSYKLVLLPSHLADYIIVHELCHLKEFNHGKNFWKLVALEMPDYLNYRKELRHFSLRKL